MTRILVAAAVLALAAFCLWHPPAPPLGVGAAPAGTAPSGASPFATGPDGGARGRRSRGAPPGDGAPLVYVAGAVARPGVYRLRDGARAGDALRSAGGQTAAAQPWGVNLAARVRDGDEIYVPSKGEDAVPGATAKRGRRARAASPPPAGDVDVNRDGADALARVPGIGRAVAARIVELRERDGPYASLDELLDVAGMSQSRLERARPFLRPP